MGEQSAEKDAREIWVDTPAPGGFVCSECFVPVESEPCLVHGPTSDADALAATITSVTNLWDEPLDDVHDIPPIVNAILAAGWTRVIPPGATS